MALTWGATFTARSFSGGEKQLQAPLQTAIAHNGPSVFNDYEGSTKSYSYMNVELHDGSHLRIRKLGREYEPTNRMAAVLALDEAAKREEVLTGVLYVNTQKADFLEMLHLAEEPLATLPQSKVRPGKAALDEIMEELRQDRPPGLSHRTRWNSFRSISGAMSRLAIF